MALEVSNKVEHSSKCVGCHSPAYSTDKSRHPALLSIHLVSPIHGDGQAHPVHMVPSVLDTSLCMRPRPHFPSPRPTLAWVECLTSNWLMSAQLSPSTLIWVSLPRAPLCPALSPCWPAEGCTWFLIILFLPAAALSPPSHVTLGWFLGLTRRRGLLFPISHLDEAYRRPLQMVVQVFAHLSLWGCQIPYCHDKVNWLLKHSQGPL